MGSLARAHVRWPLHGEGVERLARGVGVLRHGATPATRYGIAVGATLLAALARITMEGRLEERSRFLLFLPAVMFVAWLAGLGPGMVALVLGALGGGLLHVAGEEPFLARRGDALSLALYLLSGAIAILLVEAQHSAREKVERLAGELAAVNEDLEERVERRTADLNAALRELEGFTYSISHNMRAPLRAISSQAGILLEEAGPGIPAERRRRLERIKQAVKHFDLLVDGLLAFARLARCPLDLRPVDLTRLGKSVLHRIQSDEHGVEVQVQEGLSAVADQRLIETVLVCLAENAVRYRDPDRPLRLTFGESFCGDRRAYFFEDNGAGFDQAYVAKLFIPFERLHRDVEAEGVGIGLAKVRRIVERHGGQVWAEGRPGVGATFWFTLEPEPGEEV